MANQQTAALQMAGPAVRPREAWWAPQLPFMAFVAWMVMKQWIVLRVLGLAPGPVMVAATLGILLVLSPWVCLRPYRRQVLGMLILDALLTLLCYGDILNFRQFGDLVSVASLRFIGQLATVDAAVTALMRMSDWLLWIDLPIIALLPFALNHIRVPVVQVGWDRAKAGRLSARKAGVLTLIGLAIVGLVARFDPVLQYKYFGHTKVADQMGLINYHLFDVGDYLGRLSTRVMPSGGAVAEVKDWFGKRHGASIPSGPLQGAAKGKNVIVLQVESLQSFPIGLKVGGVEVTPNLNRLVKESIYFSDFYTQIGQGTTADADLAANCSLYPTRTGAVYYDYASNDFRCMPRLLREHGYSAYAMQGMRPDFWNLASAYPHVGFERFFSINDFDVSEKIGLGLSDESFLRQAASRLKVLPEPYYAFLVTLTNHVPFDFPGIPRTLPLGTLAETRVGNYLNSVHYTDGAIGQFLDTIKRDGTMEKSVLVLYGDHQGVYRDSPGMTDLLHLPPDNEVALTQLEKRIPLFVRLPGGTSAMEQKQTAGQVDIAPTLAGLLGIPTDSAYFMGRDLFREPEEVVPFYTGSAMSSQYLFWSMEGDPLQGRCYERATGAQISAQHCVPMANAAADSLRVSRLIVERNLIPALQRKP